MFRKILMFLFVALFAVTPICFARGHGRHGGHGGSGSGGGYGGGFSLPVQTVDGYYEANSFSDKFTRARSNWTGNANDRADSSAVGNAGGNVTTHASGLGYATQNGSVSGATKAGGKSFARDYGQYSVSGSKANFYGTANTRGSAFGIRAGQESVKSNLYVDGYVHQYNTAGETGYSSGSGITGENYSQGNFHVTQSRTDTGNSYASVNDKISGSAVAMGSTEVGGDFYGNHRNIHGSTQSSANTFVHNYSNEGAVQGGGNVQGVIAKGGNYAGGNSSYNFTGTNSGSGNAVLDANISVRSNSSSVSVSGSSSATSGSYRP